MKEAVDYYANHRVKLRFPWSLYHRPIVDRLARALRRSPGRDVLNVGSGPFAELEIVGALAREGRRFTVCDIDPRAVEQARALHGPRIARADALGDDGRLPYEDDRFDLVVSMDVVEHVPDPLPWLREVVRVLRPGGALFLTTPNYGSLTLDVIERTALELIARRQGFTRKGLHPSRMDRPTLRALLEQAGIPDPRVGSISLDWVLVAEGRKP